MPISVIQRTRAMAFPLVVGAARYRLAKLCSLNRRLQPRRQVTAQHSRAVMRDECPAMVRGTLLGSVLGVLPGGGAALPPFSSYALEKKFARDPALIGRRRKTEKSPSANSAAIRRSR